MKKRPLIISSCILLTSLIGVSVLTNLNMKKEIVREIDAAFSLLLEKDSGYTLKFKHVDGVNKYYVYDDNDYRDEIIIDPSSKDASGYLHYTTEVVGKHNVYIKGITSSGYILSNTVVATENKPVFDYAFATPVLFYNDQDGSSGTYTVIKDDGSKEYVDVSAFNSSYIYQRNGIMDFTTTTIENYKIDNIIKIAKEMGTNVLNLNNRFFDIETGNQWWWNNSFENSVLKRTMDAAWKQGIKCIVTDFQILTYDELDNGPDVAASRIVNSEVKKAIKHKGFYGIELNDEPLPVVRSGQTYTEIVNAGRTVKALLNAWHNDSELSKLPDPYIHTDLASYNDISDGYFDNGPEEYLQYLEDWVNGTGLNHLDFDYYTYTTYQYGVKKIGFTNYNYDSTKVIYDCINTIKERHPGIVISQTITRSNDKSRKTLTYQDVFASTLLAVSEGNNGYSTFVFHPTYQYRNSPVDEAYNKTTTFTWSKEANNQYKILSNLLDGYSLTSNEISNYYKSYLGTNYYGYGNGLRTSTSTFTNSNGHIYKMVVNFNTGDSSSTSVNVPSGKRYYVFGYDKDTSPFVGTGNNVSISNGEAILISDDTYDPFSEVNPTVTIGYKATFKGGRLETNSDKFAVRLAFNNGGLTSNDDYGIYVETSSKNHYFGKNECKVDTSNSMSYVDINLGSVLTNKNTKDVFTIKVFIKNNDQFEYSSNVKSFSVSSLIKDIYNNESSRSSVIDLYNYMLRNSLLD